MPTPSKSQLEDFFNQFKELTKRAEVHWPTTAQDDEKQEADLEDPRIICNFITILTQKDYKDTSQVLRDSFFSLYDKNKKSIFSQGPDLTKKKQLISQIQSPEDLQNIFNGTVHTKCTFLIIGYLASNDPTQAVSGCVVHYLPTSRALLIESVVVADNLTDSIPLNNAALQPSEEPKGINNTEPNQEAFKIIQNKILSWLLTSQENDAQNQGGLHQLIWKIEDSQEKYQLANRISTDPDHLNKPYQNKVQSVFHEAWNPVCSSAGSVKANDPDMGLIKAKTNAGLNALEAFHDIDVRFLKFPYYCPSPKITRSNVKCDEFLLLVFPQAPRTKNYLTVDVGSVMAFITEHSRFLNIAYHNYGEDMLLCHTLSPKIKPQFSGYENQFRENPIQHNIKSLYDNRLSPTLNHIYLHNIPRIESPRFYFKRASVSFEIIVDEDYFNPENLHEYHLPKEVIPASKGLVKVWKFITGRTQQPLDQKSKVMYCPVAHSAETDLFAYKYQSNPPYFTRYYGLPADKQIDVQFPSQFEFTSEGRAETLFCLPDSPSDHGEKGGSPDSIHSLRMNVSLSYTYFFHSAIRVWHLVLKPDQLSEKGITEIQIIKLMKFFSGSQEHASEESRLDLMRQIKFRVLTPGHTDTEARLNQPTEQDNLIQLLSDLSGVTYKKRKQNKAMRLTDLEDQNVSLRNIRSGIVAIDTGMPTDAYAIDPEWSDQKNFLDFYPNTRSPALKKAERDEIRQQIRDLYKSLNHDDIAMENDPEEFSPEGYADYVFKSYCGICLGILDYDRMGFQEIDDTLVPLPDSKTDKSFMVIHRGVLAMLGYDDDVMDTFWNTLGISAYLLIPSAVLANNDFVSRDAEKRLNKLLDTLRFDRSKEKISSLIKQRNVIDDLLNDNILEDVFQYKTEQELYREGMQRRGIEARIKDGRLKLEQLDKLLEIKQEENSNRSRKLIQISLSFLTLLSIYTPVRDFYVDEIGYKYVVKDDKDIASGSDTAEQNDSIQMQARISASNKHLKPNQRNGTTRFPEKSGAKTTPIGALVEAKPVKQYGDKQDIIFYEEKEQHSNPIIRWLMPNNALAAAHHQFMVAAIIVMIVSLFVYVLAPGSYVLRTFKRLKNKWNRI